MKRVLNHLINRVLGVRQILSSEALLRITEVIQQIEEATSGEIVFSIDAALAPREILSGVRARESAVARFSELRVWDTEHNNGVLLYLLLADREIEIVADRGIDRLVGSEKWEAICRQVEESFRIGEFERGVTLALKSIGQELTSHFPGKSENSLPNSPILS